jgi:hypothetical protein
MVRTATATTNFGITIRRNHGAERQFTILRKTESAMGGDI